jgi:HAD superfamily hydrolase (TIGR01509 family)
MSQRIVILDLEGVQIFIDKPLFGSSCSQLLQGNGYPTTEEQYNSAFRQHVRLYTIGKYSTDAQFYSRVFEQLDIPFDLNLAKKLHQLYYQSFGQYPQIPELLTKLHKHYPLLLLSNHINHWVEFLLEKFRMGGVYKYQIISKSAGVRKPDPEIYYKVMSLAAVRPEECVYFDDKEENVHAALHLGMDARLVDRSTGLTLEQVKDLIEK